MAIGKGDKKLVVIQLVGGNDYLNTIVPHGEGLYYDLRPGIRIEQDQVLPIDDKVGFNSSLEPIKNLWDEGQPGHNQRRRLPHP